MQNQPSVEGIFSRPRRGLPSVALEAAQALAGRGVEGDHAFPASDPDREITLIEAEALEALVLETHISLEAAQTRRNLLTRGVRLNDLVGKEFLVGEVRLRGIRLCEPCAHLENMTQPGVLAGLLHRGGLRAAIVESGTIRLGDPIQAELDN
jgi:MOSC domain-containing protein YiiM